MAETPAPLAGNAQLPHYNLQDTLVDSRNFNRLVEELNRQDPGLVAIVRNAVTIESDTDFAGDDTWQFMAGVGLAGFPDPGCDIVLPERFEIAAAYATARVLASAGANTLFLNWVPSWVTLPSEINDVANHLLASPITLDELADATSAHHLVVGGTAELILRLNYIPAGGVEITFVDGGAIGDVANVAVTGNDTDGWLITVSVDDTAVTGSQVGTIIAAINASLAARRLVTASWDPASSAVTTVTNLVLPVAAAPLSITASIYRSAVNAAFTRTKQHLTLLGMRLIGKVTLNDAGNATDYAVELTTLVRVRDRLNGV